MTTAYDMWSLGVLLYEMCTLEFPFDGDSMPALRTAILTKDFPPIPDSYSSNLNDLITGLLRKNPKNRSRMSVLLKDRLVKKVGAAVYGETQFNTMVVATSLPSPLLLNNDRSWMDVVRGIRSSPLYQAFLVAAANTSVFKETSKPKRTQPPERAVSKEPAAANSPPRQGRQFSSGPKQGFRKSDNSVVIRNPTLFKQSRDDLLGEDFARPTANFKKLDTGSRGAADSNQNPFFRAAIREVPISSSNKQQAPEAGKLDTSGSTVALIKRFEVNNERASALTAPQFQNFTMRKNPALEDSSARVFESPSNGRLLTAAMGARLPQREGSPAQQELPFLKDYTIETFYKSKDPGGRLPEFSAGNILRQLEQVQETESDFNG